MSTPITVGELTPAMAESVGIAENASFESTQMDEHDRLFAEQDIFFGENSVWDDLGRTAPETPIGGMTPGRGSPQPSPQPSESSPLHSPEPSPVSSPLPSPSSSPRSQGPGVDALANSVVIAEIEHELLAFAADTERARGATLPTQAQDIENVVDKHKMELLKKQIAFHQQAVLDGVKASTCTLVNVSDVPVQASNILAP